MDRIRDSTDRLNREIYRRLVSSIVSGNWSPHDPLPSSRKLAKDLAVSRTTTSLAIDRLIADGWAYSIPRKGVFVAARVARKPAPTAERSGSISPIPFELSQGAVDVFPLARWAKSQRRAWADNMPDGLYEPDPQGDPNLRARLASLLLIERGMACEADDIFIMSSTREALSLVARTMAPKCRQAVVEDPGYLAGHAVLKEGGMRIVPVPVDRSGIMVDRLPRDGSASKLLYLTPAAQFPTGATLMSDRRCTIEQWALAGDHFLFEDDYDWDHRFDGHPPLAAMAANQLKERSFYSWSFSRLLFPSLRLAMLVVPPGWREAFIDARERMDGGVTLPNQLVLADFISSGAFSAHRRQYRKICAGRREALMRHVRPFLGTLFDPDVSQAGLRMTLRASPETSAACAIALRDRGILCSTLSDMSHSSTEDDGLVLGFAAFSEDVIDQLGQSIREAFEDVLQFRRA